jgi:hypothetical protein
MNKKALRFAFNTVLNAAEGLRCETLHHENKQYHEADEVCPAEYHMQRQVHIVREYMKQHDI